MEDLIQADKYTPIPLGYTKCTSYGKDWEGNGVVTLEKIQEPDNVIEKTWLITTYGYGGKLCFDTQTEKRFVDSRVGYANLIFKGTEYELGLYCDSLKTKIIGVEPLNTERKDAECSIVEVI